MKYGDYAVVDVGARVYLDPNRRHRFDLGLHNLFDTDYATRVTRVFPDDGSATRFTRWLGMPRQFYASYGYSF